MPAHPVGPVSFESSSGHLSTQFTFGASDEGLHNAVARAKKNQQFGVRCVEGETS
jgi:hypothetical protein